MEEFKIGDENCYVAELEAISKYFWKPGILKSTDSEACSNLIDQKGKT